MKRGVRNITASNEFHAISFAYNRSVISTLYVPYLI